MKRTYRESYADLFNTSDGLDTLIIVRHLVSLLAIGEGWTLSNIIEYTWKALDKPPDAWLLLNALDHLWLCGELWRDDSVVGGSIIERWVRT